MMHRTNARSCPILPAAMGAEVLLRQTDSPGRPGSRDTEDAAGITHRPRRWNGGPLLLAGRVFHRWES